MLLSGCRSPENEETAQKRRLYGTFIIVFLYQSDYGFVRQADARASLLGTIVSPLIAFANSLTYILVNLIGGWLIVRQGVSVGAVVTIVLYARQSSPPHWSNWRPALRN